LKLTALLLIWLVFFGFWSWLNRNSPRLELSDIVPFSAHTPHSDIYNIACLFMLVVATRGIVCLVKQREKRNGKLSSEDEHLSDDSGYDSDSSCL